MKVTRRKLIPSLEQVTWREPTVTSSNSAISSRLFPRSRRFLICSIRSGVNFVSLPLRLRGRGVGSVIGAILNPQKGVSIADSGRSMQGLRGAASSAGQNLRACDIRHMEGHRARNSLPHALRGGGDHHTIGRGRIATGPVVGGAAPIGSAGTQYHLLDGPCDRVQ